MNDAYKPPVLIVLMLLILLLASLTIAMGGDPTDQLRQTTEKILAIVQDPALKGPDKDVDRQTRMKAVVDQRFDWASMARSAMGAHWRDLADVQRTEFADVFGKLIEKTYMSKVESYSGEKILYKGDKVDDKYGVVDVTIVTLRGTDIPVSYRVLKKGEEWLVYDVTIEGVSLVNNYRSQIGAILNSSSYEGLIARLRAKIAAQATQPADGKAGAATQPEPGKETL